MRKGLLSLIGFLWVALLGACGDSQDGGGEQIRAFAEGMSLSSGFISFYHDAGKGKIYLLLDADNRELLYQESLPRGVGSNDIGLDRGQLGGAAALVRFEPAGDKVLLKHINQRYRALSDNAAERAAVEEAFANSVIWGFPVVARDGEQRLVDATAFLLRDGHGVGRRLKAAGEGSFKPDPSRSAVYLPRSRAFPRNTELESLITLVGDDPGVELRSVAPDPHSFTVHMHHSFIALPEPGFEPRLFHPQSGFWPIVFADYAAGIDEPLEKRYIPRHRLRARAQGEKPGHPDTSIVYYLDPGTPEPVRSALLDGARWWTDAFAAAGFGDAFRVEMLPDDADPMDVRYNMIQWVHRSTRGWSYGSSVVDPRTGEIIKGHVTLGSLRVRQDLLIARSMTSPFAADVDDADDAAALAMALARIRQLSAHEVGHTLGLAHNFAASTKDRASVMDYPHPLLTLTEDGRIGLRGAYAEGIGEWDKRAIRYGYGSFTGSDEEPEIIEREALAELLDANRRDGFEFLSDPDSRELRDFHPRSHLWDNGADPVVELERVMQLRRAALLRFGRDSLPSGVPLSDLQEAVVPVYLFHRYQMEAAAKLVGGADYSYAINGQGVDALAEPVKAVSADRQRAAIDAILTTLGPDELALPQALLAQIPPKAYGYRRTRESAPARTGELFDPLTLAEAAASHGLQALLHPERLARMALQHALDEEQLSLHAYFELLQDRLLYTEYVGLQGAIDRRVVGLLLRHWRALFADENAAPEVRAAAHAALERAARLMRARHRGAPEYASYYRFETAAIERALAGESVLPESSGVDVPPGSPIGSVQ